MRREGRDGDRHPDAGRQPRLRPRRLLQGRAESYTSAKDCAFYESAQNRSTCSCARYVR